MAQEIDKKTRADTSEEMREFILGVIRESEGTSPFEDKRTADTPIDSYSVVNRRYVTLNGGVASRPKSSVATVGQPYFATDTFIPMTFSIGGWRNGVGSIVAGHR